MEHCSSEPLYLADTITEEQEGPEGGPLTLLAPLPHSYVKVKMLLLSAQLSECCNFEYSVFEAMLIVAPTFAISMFSSWMYYHSFLSL